MRAIVQPWDNEITAVMTDSELIPENSVSSFTVSTAPDPALEPTPEQPEDLASEPEALAAIVEEHASAPAEAPAPIAAEPTPAPVRPPAAQSEPAAAAPSVSRVLPPVEAHVAGAALTAPELAHIECLLARYIGPLAKHLVKRAAARATGRADLIARLTAELDAESDRSAFAQRCKQLPSA